MTDADLDLSYTALCEALTAVGPQRSELLLSMLCVALMARSEQAGPVLELIDRSRQRLREETRGG
jgi:hypothetical protein